MARASCPCSSHSQPVRGFDCHDTSDSELHIRRLSNVGHLRSNIQLLLNYLNKTLTMVVEITRVVMGVLLKYVWQLVFLSCL